MLFSLKPLNLAVSGFPSTVKPYAELHKGNFVLCQPASIYLRLRVKLCKWSVKVYKNNESEMPGIYPYLISESPLWTLDILFFSQFSFFFSFFMDPRHFILDPRPSTHKSYTFVDLLYFHFVAWIIITSSFLLGYDLSLLFLVRRPWHEIGPRSKRSSE